MKTALDDLKIVDVASKPAGLSADLKAGENFLDNREAISDLRSRGFAAIPASMGQDQEIISNEGEVICTLNDGVEYVLRFGDLRMGDGSHSDNPDASEGDEAAQEKPSGQGVQRYLFAMARFNEDAVKRPELDELPELPEAAAATESEQTAEQSADTATEDEEEEEEEESDEADASPETADAEDNLAATPSGASDAAEASTDAASESTDATAESASEDNAESDAVAAAISERKRIEKENQRKLDEYQAKLDKGRQTVKDLNLRFGDWYFVVSNDTFQKIRLSRDDVIKKKGTDESATEGGASAAGAPGMGVPGLPSIPGVGQ
jgi:hypothetical protein